MKKLIALLLAGYGYACFAQTDFTPTGADAIAGPRSLSDIYAKQDQGTPAKAFPLGFASIYAPKDRHTIQAVEINVGKLAEVPFGKRSYDLTAFTYLGLDTSAAKGAAGFGVKYEFAYGPSLRPHLGLTYGTVTDGHPHLGIEIGVSAVLK